MLPRGIHPIFFGHDDVVAEGLVRGNHVQPIGPPSLVQGPKVEHRPAIEHHPIDATLIFGNLNLPESEVAANGVNQLVPLKRSLTSGHRGSAP